MKDKSVCNKTKLVITTEIKKEESKSFEISVVLKLQK